MHYQRAAAEEMLSLPSGRGGTQEAAISVMFRTALFPFDRSRLRNVTPRPRAAFEALSLAFRQVIASRPFALPTLAEVKACDVEP